MAKEKKEKDPNIVRRGDIIKNAADRTGQTQELLSKVLNGFLSAISENVRDGKTVILDNFGKFELRTVKEHVVTLPNKEKMTVPEHKAVKFKAYNKFLLYFMK